MKCFYHHDLDGKCSAAIVRKYYKGKDIEFISIDYKDPFPIESIQSNEEIVIVDYAPETPELFQKILQISPNVTWIDHHISAIEKHSECHYIDGLRKDGVAACVLTWEYFFLYTPTPYAVKLLGDYDVWTFWYGDDTRHFQLGVKTYNTNPTNDDLWRYLLGSVVDTGVHVTVSDIISKGETISSYQKNYNKELIKNHAFSTDFEGYKVVACNAGLTGSMLFDSVDTDYDLMMPFYYDGSKWIVSIYTDKEIDCARLAIKYGGGGHKKASGFQVEELPFKHKTKITNLKEN